MRVYISGPMTGHKDLNIPVFQAAETLLTNAGFPVVNPAKINPDPATGWTTAMRRDIRALMDCDCILMLPGWMESRGAKLEQHIAADLGMPVYYRIEDLTENSRQEVSA